VDFSLSLEQRFAASNPAEDDGFLRAIQIRSEPSFGGEVMPSAHVVRFYGVLKIPAEYTSDISLTKLTDISRQVPPCFAVGVLAGICQRALVD
jgi:hypothetical protein